MRGSRNLAEEFRGGRGHFGEGSSEGSVQLGFAG